MMFYVRCLVEHEMDWEWGHYSPRCSTQCGNKIYVSTEHKRDFKTILLAPIFAWNRWHKSTSLGGGL